jgi:hypothetical protein
VSSSLAVRTSFLKGLKSSPQHLHFVQSFTTSIVGILDFCRTLLVGLKGTRIHESWLTQNSVFLWRRAGLTLDANDPVADLVYKSITRTLFSLQYTGHNSRSSNLSLPMYDMTEVTSAGGHRKPTATPLPPGRNAAENFDRRRTP